MSRFGFEYLLLNLLRVTPVIRATEPTGLSEYYRVEVSPVSFRLYVECRFRDTDEVPIIQADSASDDCNDERDGSNWSSRMSFNRVKHELGLFPRDQLVTSVYNERVNSVV